MAGWWRTEAKICAGSLSALSNPRAPRASVLPDLTSAASRPALKAYRFKKGSANNPGRLSWFYYQCRLIFQENAPELARPAIELALDPETDQQVRSVLIVRPAATEVSVRPHPPPLRRDCARAFAVSDDSGCRKGCRRHPDRVGSSTSSVTINASTQSPSSTQMPKRISSCRVGSLAMPHDEFEAGLGREASVIMWQIRLKDPYNRRLCKELTLPVNLFRTKAKAFSVPSAKVNSPPVSIPKTTRAMAMIQAIRSARCRPFHPARIRARHVTRGGLVSPAWTILCFRFLML